MPKAHLINSKNIISTLNKIFKNININNTVFCNELSQIIGDTNISENKVKSIYYDTFITPLKQYNTSKPLLYTTYWTIRGWSYKEACNFVKKQYDKDNVFFTKNEILQYILSNNPFNMNIDNISFIKQFIDTIHINDHITLNNIYNVFFCAWANNFYNQPNKNKGYLTLNKNYYLCRGFDEKYAQTQIAQQQKERSPRAIEYYTKRGYNEKDAKINVSKIQQKNANQSKCTYEYWKNLGLTDEEVNKKVAYYNDLRSVWGKKYWLSKGYNEEEAIKKTHEYNHGCFECKEYNHDIAAYINSMNNISERQKHLWKFIFEKPELFQTKIKHGWLSNVSKAETKCFQYLMQEIDNNIKHANYIIIFPPEFESDNNAYFYSCDGYLEYNGKIIIIEYDGGIGIFHQKEKDLTRDSEILLLDKNVLGILHIQETVFKKKTNIKQLIIDGLQKIKNSEEKRVILA